MSFTTAWVNSYHSLMKLHQDPITGMLRGTYASTTGGTGTYDVIGWAALPNATPEAGQTMAISILWRSNDGGKSDPSHEVSGMAGQAVVMISEENLELQHLFVETDPSTTPQMGFYPDKLIFVPSKENDNIVADSPIETGAPSNPSTVNNPIVGTWTGSLSGSFISLNFELPQAENARLTGMITYADGTKYPIAGYTDIYALQPTFTWQGVTFCTYLDGTEGRHCIAIAGYLNLATHEIHLMQLSAQSTDHGSTWYQTQITPLVLQRA